MAIAYTWLVEQLEAYPKQGIYTDVVFNVRWRLNAIDDGDQATAFGSVPVELSKTDPFTPYEDLTQDQVLDWVKTALNQKGVADLEADLAKQINSRKNPTTVSPALPWAGK